MRLPTAFLPAFIALPLLYGCVAAPGQDAEMREVGAAASQSVGDGAAGGQPAGEAGEPVPELTLNLTEPDCACTLETPDRDKTFLDRGFTALSQGDHIEAVQYFQRYQRLEKSPVSAWEAGIAIAYVSTLQHSPFYDADAARKSYRRLQKEFRESWQVDERCLLVAMSLESFRVMYRHVDDLEDTNATLREDLQKREEALKRLRELTLGQKATRP